MYESNISGSRIHTGPSRPSEFAEVNKALHEWYLITCSKNTYSGGPQLIEKAKEIAERLNIPNFKGSRGWLEKWKKRYNIKRVKVCGESVNLLFFPANTTSKLQPLDLGITKNFKAYYRQLLLSYVISKIPYFLD